MINEINTTVSVSSTLVDFAWLVYLIDVLAVEDFNDGIGIFMGLSILGYTVMALIPTITKQEYENSTSRSESDSRWWYEVKPKVSKSINIVLVFCMCYLVYYTFTPNKETAWQIAGLVIAAEVADNPKVQEIAGTGYEILDKKLKIYSSKLSKELEEALDKVGE